MFQNKRNNFKNSVIARKNFNETWKSLIDFANDSFFKIENVEKIVLDY